MLMLMTLLLQLAQYF